MAKNKKPRVPNHNHDDGPKQRGSGISGSGGKPGKKKMATFSKLNTSISKSKGNKASRKQQKQKQQQQQRQKQQNAAIIPFGPRDRILLVGEGDFSFAYTLATHHGCKSVLATSYDSEQTVHEKYPHAEQNIDRLIAAGQTPSKPLKRKREDDDSGQSDIKRKNLPEFNGLEESGEEKSSQHGNDMDDQSKAGKGDDTPRLAVNNQGPKILFSVDAKKLGAGVVGGGKEIRNGFPRPRATQSSSSSSSNRRPLPSQETLAPSGSKKGRETGTAKAGPWDIICFNFPHVGGLSTDVNRQVRSNQEFLVSFFKACVPLLSTPDKSADNHHQSEGFMSSSEDDNYSDDHYGSDSEEGSESASEKRKQKPPPSPPPRTEPGQILVTIFEGEPYTLWNIRDLARHTGLRVVRSFKFPWSSYPGYSHARTIGEIEAKDGSGRGGWKGEDRDARTFIFEVKGLDGGDGKVGGGKGKVRKKGRADEDDSSSSDG